MSRTAGSLPTRVVFYGRTNRVDEHAMADECRRYRACTAIAEKFGVVPHWFCHGGHAPSSVMGAHRRESDNRLGPSPSRFGKHVNAVDQFDRKSFADDLSALSSSLDMWWRGIACREWRAVR